MEKLQDIASKFPSRALDKLVIFLFITIVIFGTCIIATVSKADRENSNVPNEREEESYPSLERNFLLKEDVSYEDVKKMRGDLEDQGTGAVKENLMNVNVNTEILRENKELMEKIAKTFSGIVGKLADDRSGESEGLFPNRSKKSRVENL